MHYFYAPKNVLERHQCTRGVHGVYYIYYIVHRLQTIIKIDIVPTANSRIHYEHE